MTQPEVERAAYEQYAAQLLAIEERTAEDVESIFKPAMRALFALLLSLWPGDDATLDEMREATRQLNLDALLGLVSPAQRRITQGANDALIHGFSVAMAEAEVAGVTGIKPPDMAKNLNLATYARVERLERVMAVNIAKSKVMLSMSDTQDDVMASIAIAQRGVNSAVLTARYVTNEASNQALAAVSHASIDLVSVWRAERDACVHCLAYQGQIDTGDGYPVGLTFGKTPLSTDAVDQPPLHPNCRCTQSLVHKDVVGPLADALKREAKRSVLRGWSLPSESNKTRVDAAQRLLARGPGLPKSVQDYARRAVKQGEFGRGRNSPT